LVIITYPNLFDYWEYHTKYSWNRVTTSCWEMKPRTSFLVVDSADEKRQLYKLRSLIAVHLGYQRHSSLIFVKLLSPWKI
jgi:hypothetical protein